jgi:hypothetical protein
MMARDWTVVTDDMLVERHRACIQCGRRAERMDLRTVGNRAWCVPMCGRCVAEDPTGEAIEARLATRGEP